MPKNETPTTVQLLHAAISAALSGADIASVVADADIKMNNGKEQDDGSFRFTFTVTPPFQRDGDLTTEQVRNGEARPGESVEANPIGTGFAEFKVESSGRTNYSLLAPNGQTIKVPHGECQAVEYLDTES